MIAKGVLLRIPLLDRHLSRLPVLTILEVLQKLSSLYLCVFIQVEYYFNVAKILQ